MSDEDFADVESDLDLDALESELQTLDRHLEKQPPPIHSLDDPESSDSEIIECDDGSRYEQKRIVKKEEIGDAVSTTANNQDLLENSEGEVEKDVQEEIETSDNGTKDNNQVCPDDENINQDLLDENRIDDRLALEALESAGISRGLDDQPEPSVLFEEAEYVASENNFSAVTNFLATPGTSNHVEFDYDQVQESGTNITSNFLSQIDDECSQSAYTELSSHHYRNEEGFNEDVYNSEEEEDDLNLHLSDGNESDGNTDDEDNIPINFRNALILNEQYQSELRNLIETLQASLKENEERQQKLTEEINDISCGKPLEDQDNAPSQNSIISRNPVTVFHAPYFKDVNLYTHPPNQDKIVKDANGELDLYLTNPRELNETEKNELVDAVRKNAIEKRLVSVKKQEKIIFSQMCKAGISVDERYALEKRMRKLYSEEKDIKSLPDSLLFRNKDEEYDWMMIAAKVFKRSISHSTIRLMWKNLLHPMINRNSWTKAEDELLLRIVNNPDQDGLFHARKNWDVIANILGTGRNAFLCFNRYQMKHDPVTTNRNWTTAEDFRLRQLVKQTRIHRFIPWNKVAFYMDNRTKDQCYQRYMCSLREKLQRGFFNEVEDSIVIVGVRLFGPLWNRIADFIPTRTPMQIHSRYNTFLKVNFENWTADEDIDLLQMVKLKGANDWKSISADFPNRTRSQCRQRFHLICHNFRKSKDKFSLSQLAYSEEESVQKKRQNDLYKTVNERVSDFLRKFNNINENDSENNQLPQFLPSEYHITPDGDKVPKLALMNFMKQLSQEIPQPENKSSIQRDLGLFKSKFRAVDKKGNVVTLQRSIHKPAFVGEISKEVERKMEKVMHPTWPFKLRGRVKETYKTKKELRIIRQNGRYLLDVLEASECYKFGPETSITDLKKVLRKPNDCHGLDPVIERRKQFLEALRAQDQEKHQIIPQPAIQIVPNEKVPKIKTYTRKTERKPYFKEIKPIMVSRSDSIQSSSSQVESNYLKFVPPHLNTLVGARSLMANIPRLRQQSMVDIAGEKKYAETNRIAASNVLKNGIHDHIFFGLKRRGSSVRQDHTQTNDGADGKILPQEADRRLRNRFLSLFLWPAIMSITKPNERSNMFDLHELEDVVAADQPMDTVEVIEESKAKVANTPRVIILPCEKQEPPDDVHNDDNLQFGIPSCSSTNNENFGIGSDEGDFGHTDGVDGSELAATSYSTNVGIASDDSDIDETCPPPPLKKRRKFKHFKFGDRFEYPQFCDDQ